MIVACSSRFTKCARELAGVTAKLCFALALVSLFVREGNRLSCPMEFINDGRLSCDVTPM